MAILTIWASPNENGLTATAKNQVAAGIKEKKVVLEEIHLNKCRMQHCQACGNGWGTCRVKGSCSIEDDFQLLYDKMIRAEGIVFVTPVYWHDLAENLKAVLDRLRRCEVSCAHALVGKKCLLVACAGGTGHGVARCLTLLDDTLGNMEMTVVDSLPVIRFNKGYMLPMLKEAGMAFAECAAGNMKGAD